MPVVRIPLVGSLTSRDPVNTRLYGTSQKDQYFKDCCFGVIRNGVTGRISTYVTAREGFTDSAYPSGASGEGTAVRLWRGHSSPGLSNVLSAFGNTNSTLYYESTSLGAITGQCIFISETVISGVANAVFVSASNRAYFYDQVGAALTEITDVDFPPKQTPALTITGNFAHMDGYAFIMCTNGQIWHSDLNSLSAWTSTSSITAQEYPDRGVGVMRHKNFIVAFSKYSIEFFINGGNATGSVLTRVPHMAIRIGCLGELAMCHYGDTICFMGSHEGTIGIFQLEGGNLTKLSTTEIDLALEDVVSTLTPTQRLNVLYSLGKSYLVWTTAKGTGSSFVYDFETKIWQYWVLASSITQSDCPGAGISGCYYVGDDSTKYLFNSRTENITAEIQIGKIDFDTLDRKTCKKIRLIGDKATITSNVAVSWTDDDSVSYSTARNIDMSSALPQLHRCGTFRRRLIKLTGIADSATDIRQRLEAIEIEYEVGRT